MAITKEQTMSTKTANIILVYKNISIQDYENTSRVFSWTSPLTRLAKAIEACGLSFGKDRWSETSILSICGGGK